MATPTTFFDELAAFLDQSAVPDVPDVDKHEEVLVTGDDELLLASNELLAETKELLASYETPSTNSQEEDVSSSSVTVESSGKDTQKAASRGKMSAEKRREIRSAQAAKRRLRHRQQLKLERETLKVQATELSSQLQELQTARVQREAKQGGNLMYGAWRAIAVRQLERRVQAEQQQKMLRAELVGNARKIHEMNVQLHDVLQGARETPFGLIEPNSDASGAELFKTMLSELDSHYARTDEVFQGLKFKKAPPGTYDLTRKWQNGVQYLDSTDRMEFPCDFEQTASAMTTIMMSDPGVNIENVESLDVEDAATFKFHAKYQFKPEKFAKVVLYGATRKYQEKDRVVFVWRCFIEGCGKFEGFNSNETMWMVIRSVESDVEGTCGSTVVECYSRMVPMGFGECDEDMDKFLKFLVKMGEEESKEMVEMMEKLLVSEP
ncbi:hypothetical protein P3T76_007529 [Phytophthora citrophthora]|uniref:M96 mating-specific protein family n=1 Tax=Phytophthora citrophthora TaxID=4793 RepID=A0AAD9LL62_9STRA|nr:hypothetical protein P3T76_007529 [Phytophthora citrophthora]